MPVAHPFPVLLPIMAVAFVVIVGIAVAATVFWIVELVDVLRRTFPNPNDKIIWLVIVLLLHLLGSLIYFFVGKQQGYLPGEMPPTV